MAAVAARAKAANGAPGQPVSGTPGQAGGGSVAPPATGAAEQTRQRSVAPPATGAAGKPAAARGSARAGAAPPTR